MGADDYVTKPFSLLELLARIEALMRRTAIESDEQKPESGGYQFGDIRIDTKRKLVFRGDAQVDLTLIEYMLLLALARRDGGVASRQDLLTEVWGHKAAVMTRTVDTHVGELRRKLETNAARPDHIITVRKMGYRLL